MERGRNEKPKAMKTEATNTHEAGQKELIYWHLSPIENKESILKDGLKCNDYGEIFLFLEGTVHDPEGLFESRRVSDSIARNQVFCEEFDIYMISYKGINSEIQNDNVAECTSALQFFIKQEKILPQFIWHKKRRSIKNKKVGGLRKKIIPNEFIIPKP